MFRYLGAAVFSVHGISEATEQKVKVQMYKVAVCSSLLVFSFIINSENPVHCSELLWALTSNCRPWSAAGCAELHDNQSLLWGQELWSFWFLQTHKKLCAYPHLQMWNRWCKPNLQWILIFLLFSFFFLAMQYIASQTLSPVFQPLHPLLCKRTHRHTDTQSDRLCLVLVGHSPSAGQMINANACWEF